MSPQQPTYKRSDIVWTDELPKVVPQQDYAPKLTSSAAQAVYSPPGGKQQVSAEPAGRPTMDKIVNILRPILGGAAAGMGTIAASADPFNLGPIGAPAVGAGLGTGVDLAMQQLLSKPDTSFAQQWSGYEPGTIGAQLANSGSMLAENELGGRLAGRAFDAAKNLGTGVKGAISEWMHPGAVVGDIYKLNPTYSQYYQSMFGKQPVSKWIEDVFDSKLKAASMEQSAQIAQTQGMNKALNYSGRTYDDPTSPFGTPQSVTAKMQESLLLNNAKSLSASEREAQGILRLAKSNPKTFNGNLAASPDIDALAKSQAGVAYKDLQPQQQQQVLQMAQRLGLQSPIRVIEGPINLDSTLTKAQNFLNKKQALYGDLVNVSPNDKPLVTAAQNLLQAANAQVQNGKIIKSDPISFEDAWNFKKLANDFGWGDHSVGAGPAAPAFRDSSFKDLAHSIDDDITHSIGQWENNPNGSAQTHWQNVKTIVNQRHELFNEDGVRQLIQNVNDNMPQVNAILSDSKKLQRALSAGELELPGGVVESTNLRKDLQGYVMTKYMQEPYFNADPQTGKGLFNYQKLNSDWNDPNMQESYDKLFSQQQRADISQFFKNISMTQGKIPTGGNFKLWATRGGVALAPTIATGMLTGSSMYGAGVLGVTVGGMGLARLLTNPTSARLLAGLASGTSTGASDALLSRAIVGALQGTGSVLTVNYKDGTSVKGVLKDKFEPLNPF